ncbi:HSP70-domain-containing protein [Microthyrium microscopicum]|uniref:HSP70-domain-containing protein n=1 Tax=Microthyrium microscopicum TaxID=703497 RepID=A0A6A6UTT0_9PEZI|nr:HSP70-domain-containing protein [Microthyrium microscopicum]
MSADGEPSSRVAIGIAFGNSYSSIAHTTGEGKAEVIANEEGDRQIPSILAYVDGEELQGTQAKAQLVRNPKNTVAYFRDFLGQEFKSIDPSPCHQSAHPIQSGNSIAFSIRDTEAEESNNTSVSEIATRHIRVLAASAADFLGKSINSAVITVPTNFSDAQKEALSKASADAGVEVLQLISEPVAAVLAYDARTGTDPSDKTVVVADIGGTRTDIAVVASRGGIYTILATAHDYEYSGTQLDKVLVEYFAKEFLKKNKSAEDPRNNARSLAKLTLESEAVKKALSLGGSANFSVESLSSGIDFTATINRTRYELLAGKIFAAISRLVLSVVAKAGLDPLDISDVIMSGGSSHTPRLARNMQSTFSSAAVHAPATSTEALNPSELAARGAAIQASLISDFDVEDVRESCHPVVTATAHLSTALGLLCISADEKSHGVFVPLVEAETPVPVRRSKIFPVPGAGGDVIVKLCEGTSEVISKPVEKKTKPETNGDDDDSDDDDDSEEEEEEIKEKKWKHKATIAEAAIRGVKKGAKIEVQLNIGPDLAVTMVAREVGGKGGVRGVVPAS